MDQEGGRWEGGFGRVEGSSHGRSPGETGGMTSKSVSEGAEDGCGGRKETAVEVDEAKETLEVFEVGGLRSCGCVQHWREGE